MKPEEKARVKIDQWLTEAGWKVINRDEFEADSSAVAVREGLLKGNREADYFLFINGKAVGIGNDCAFGSTIHSVTYRRRFGCY